MLNFVFPTKCWMSPLVLPPAAVFFFFFKQLAYIASSCLEKVLGKLQINTLYKSLGEASGNSQRISKGIFVVWKVEVGVLQVGHFI